MRRITLQEIIEAYKAVGKKPVQRQWNARGNKCCAMAVMDAWEHKNFSAMSDLDGTFKLLGLDSQYGWGFVSGFDDNPFFDSWGEHRTQGWHDGKAAWEAVDKEFNV